MSITLSYADFDINQLGITPDCREKKVTIEDIAGLTEKSSNMLDFLKKLPVQSLQTFTFVTNSLSLHRGKMDANGEGQVSLKWPRVIRMSNDGKMTVTFVCDPKNPTYGKVEIMHFDDREKEFKFTEIDFGNQDSSTRPPKNRVHQNPESCIKCHSPGFNGVGKPLMKPIWPEYFQWSDCKDNRGIQMFGGHDDSMMIGEYRRIGFVKNHPNCSEKQFQEKTDIERDQFKKFLNEQKNNECFETLPWPQSSSSNKNYDKKFEYYPYTTSDQNASFYLRPNLKLTEVYALLHAKSLGKKSSQGEGFDKLKYMLGMEAIGCKIPSDWNQKFLQTKKIKKFQEGGLMGNYLFEIGISKKDLTLNFLSADSGYATGSFNILDAVRGEVFRSVLTSEKKFDSLKLQSDNYRANAGNFKCLQELGGRFVVDDRAKHLQACELLKAEQIKIFNELFNYEDCQPDMTKTLPTVNPTLDANIGKIVLKLRKGN